MKIKKIIENAAVYLGLDAILPLLAGGDGDIQAEKDLKLLLRCTDFVIKELAAEYIPPVAFDTVTAENGKITYGKLSKRVADVTGITGVSGNKADFKVYPGYIAVADGKYTVRYTYIPDDCVLDGESCFGAKIDERIAAYGVVSEYYIISGQYDEAAVFNNKFVNSLTAICGNKSEMRLHERRWA